MNKEEKEIKVKNKIPIENIYYLVFYAFDAVKNKEFISKKDLEKESFEEVLIDLFLFEVNKIIKYGLYKKYNLIEEESFFIKGKINLKESLLKTNNKVVCNFDDFNPNDIVNRIIKFTLNKLLFVNGIDKDIKRKIKNKYFYFEEIPLKEFTLKEMSNLKFTRLNKHYELALRLAQFIIFELIPKDSRGKFDFIHIFENEETMNRIYEKFLLKFYQVHLTDYKVKGNARFNWELEKVSDGDFELPLMETDIEIRKKGNKDLIVIDAKYYTKAFSDRYETKKFHSANLYQMSAYLNYYEKLKNKEENLVYDNIKGILLYPSNGYEFHEVFEKNNRYLVEFATLDLSKDWKEIKSDLLKIIHGDLDENRGELSV